LTAVVAVGALISAVQPSEGHALPNVVHDTMYTHARTLARACTHTHTHTHKYSHTHT